MAATHSIRALLVTILVALFYSLAFSFFLSPWWTTLLLGGGILLGGALMYFDQTLFINWYKLPYVFSKSFLFLLVYTPLAIFMMTSSGSLIGIGLVVGMGIFRLTELSQYLLGKQTLEQVLITGEKPFSRQEVRYITAGLAGLLVGLTVALFI